jgi:RNA-directed DNA polymerase
MKRVHISLVDIASYDNLLRATWKAARGKQNRPEVRRFIADLDNSLQQLSTDILQGNAPYGRYRQFYIHDPKLRLIHAACFEDRVLQHAVMNLAEPVFERTLVPSTYACRPDKGVHKAVLQVQKNLQRFPWFVMVDIRHYFPSIDHSRLFELLGRRFKGRDFMDLLGRILASYSAQPEKRLNAVDLMSAKPSPAGWVRGNNNKDKNLFKSPHPILLPEGEGVRVLKSTALCKGLPIGSLTSQHFANYYLDGADRFLLEHPLVCAHVRYMDDTLWWCRDKASATRVLSEYQNYLWTERQLQLKPDVQINRSQRGVTYCGYRVLPGTLRLSPRKKRRYQLLRRQWEAKWEAGAISSLKLQEAYAAVHAITLHADSIAWRKRNLQVQPSSYIKVAG